MIGSCDINEFIKASEDDMQKFIGGKKDEIDEFIKHKKEGIQEFIEANTERIRKSTWANEFAEKPKFIKASNNKMSHQIYSVRESNGFNRVFSEQPIKDFAPPVVTSRPKPLKRILLADGDLLLRKSLASYLSFSGFKVVQVADGVEAINEINKGKFDLMILELKLTQMGGLEILNIVRNELKLHTPIIILTASGVDEVELECLEMGADDFVTKPFSPTVLKARIDKSIEKCSG